GDSTRDWDRAERTRRRDQAAESAEARSARWLDRRRRRELGRSDAASFGHYRARKRLARLARRGLRRNVHRGQRNDPSVEDARGDDGRFVRGRQIARGDSGRVQGENQGLRLQALCLRWAAATAQGVTNGFT